eukprot:2235081-Pyramimonas_sp.AAC.1
MLSKVQLLEDQFVTVGADVIGIQEGRAPASLSKEGHSYTMMSAAANDDGSCGVQIWVRHGLLVKTWEVVSPRLMFAIVAKRGVDFGVVSGHAPHLLAPEIERNDWWDLFGSKVSHWRRRYAIPWYICADTNGRVGSVLSPMIGISSPSVENDNGTKVRQFAEQQHMMIANTWGPEAGHTWTSPRGAQARVD